jgi:uncharacterized protein YlxP (DUF503 family)
MIIGSAVIRLRLFTPESLKEKRHIIKSIISKIRGTFNVSIAEISLNDKWQMAEIGMACVSNDSKVVDSTFNSIINFIEKDSRVEIVDISIELL